jgi:acyl-CoA thioester hydrolase
MRVRLDISTDPADYSFRHPVRVRFAETDAMGIVHHGAYLPYLEEARVAYLRAIGHPYVEVQRVDGVDFAVLEVSLRYLQPLRFDDEVTVRLRVGGASRATFQVAYLLTVAGRPRATAVTVHGCVDRDGRPQRMPAWLAAATA